MEASSVDQVPLYMQRTVEDRDRVFNMIKNHLVHSTSGFEWSSTTNVTLENLVGLHEAKAEFLDAMKERRGYQRLLLFGPPASGKSHLVRAAVTELKANLLTLSHKKPLIDWASNLEMYTKALCEICRENCLQTDTILFLNHLDFYCNSGDNESQRIAHFLNHVQWAWAESGLKLAIVASSSQPQELNENIVLEFNRFIFVPTLNFEERKELLWRQIPNIWKGAHTLTEENMSNISKKCFAMLASQFDILISQACEARNPDWNEEDDKGVESELLQLRYKKFKPLSMEDFEKVFSENFLRLDMETFEKYQLFYSKYEKDKSLLSIQEREILVLKEKEEESKQPSTLAQLSQLDADSNESWLVKLFSWL